MKRIRVAQGNNSFRSILILLIFGMFDIKSFNTFFIFTWRSQNISFSQTWTNVFQIFSQELFLFCSYTWPPLRSRIWVNPCFTQSPPLNLWIFVTFSICASAYFFKLDVFQEKCSYFVQMLFLILALSYNIDLIKNVSSCQKGNEDS